MLSKLRGLLSGSLSPLLTMAATVALILAANPGVALVAQQSPTRIAIGVSAPPQGRGVKVENGYVVVWRLRTENRDEDQVGVFTRFGSKLLSLNPLRSVADARSVSIHDVSVGPTGLVAVAAVFVDSRQRPAASLLLYSSTGGLVHAFRMDPDKEIRKVEVDPQEEIWAFGMGAGGKDPATVSLLVNYDREGNVMEQFLPRSAFPLDAQVVEEGPGSGGEVSFGLADGKLWFWLPASRKLGTISRDGTGLRVFDTGLPYLPGFAGPSGRVETVVLRSYWIPPGRLLATARFHDESSGRSEIYEWVQATTSWKLIPRPETANPSAEFLTVDGNEMVLISFWPERSVYELEWLPLPPST